MEIHIKLENTNYSIEVEPSCFTAYQHGINTQEIKGVKSKNYGQPTKTIIGHFSKVSSAVKKIVQSHESEKDEVLSLQQYAERIEAAYVELMIQVGDK